MENNRKKKINARVYRSVISYLEDRIRVYEDIYESIEENNESNKRECGSRLNGCVDILSLLEDNFEPEVVHRKTRNIPTGNLRGPAN